MTTHYVSLYHSIFQRTPSLKQVNLENIEKIIFYINMNTEKLGSFEFKIKNVRFITPEYMEETLSYEEYKKATISWPYISRWR